jgi:hypothetical protein
MLDEVSFMSKRNQLKQNWVFVLPNSALNSRVILDFLDDPCNFFRSYDGQIDDSRVTLDRTIQLGAEQTAKARQQADQFLKARLKPELYDVYRQPHEQLARALGDGFRLVLLSKKFGNIYLLGKCQSPV